MTGLEKMTAQITDEAKAEAETLLAAARDEAAGLAAEAENDIKKIEEAASKKAGEDAEKYMDRVKSSADLRRRTALLTAKQEVIAEVMEKAYEKVDGLDTPEYFDLIRKLLAKYSQAQSGEIVFSKKDLDRMPSGFEGEIKEIAAKNGGSLELKNEPAAIANGFILIYGGIEENCTFRSLFDTQRDELSDLIHRELFS